MISGFDLYDLSVSMLVVELRNVVHVSLMAILYLNLCHLSDHCNLTFDLRQKKRLNVLWYLGPAVKCNK